MLLKIWKAFFGLFSENGTTLSVGRVSFWISFGIACSIWLTKPPIDVPESLFLILAILLLYNTCKKVLHMIAPGIAFFLSRGRLGETQIEPPKKKKKDTLENILLKRDEDEND